MSYSSYGGSGSYGGSSGSSGGYQSDELSAAEQQQAQQRVQEIQQKMQVQKLIANLTDTCFEKCHTKGSLGSADTKCMEQCANRYVDTTKAIMQYMTNQAQAQQ